MKPEGPKWIHEGDKEPSVTYVSSLAELEKLKETSEPNIIVVDGLKVAGEGLFVADQIRKVYGLQAPLVFISGNPRFQDSKKRNNAVQRVVTFLDAGGNAYLFPDERDLLPRVLTVLQRRIRLRSHENKKIERFEGRLVIDPVSCTVAVDGTIRALTALEFNILREIAQSQDPVIDEHIREAVNGGFGSLSNVLESKISQMRKKIKPLNIETVPNIDGKRRYQLTFNQFARFAQRMRGEDGEGNTLIALDEIDRLILEIILSGSRSPSDIVKELQGHRKFLESGAVSTRIQRRFGAIQSISSARLIKPDNAAGEWLYKRPPLAK